MRKYFRVGGRRYHVFANPEHHWIAMDRGPINTICTYKSKPMRVDELGAWSYGDFLSKYPPHEDVRVSQNAERAMKKVGWRRSLRRLRER
jgi:hypothetical protein